MLKERNKKGDAFGVHRVLDSSATLPQAAERLDNSLPVYNNEILIEVERLNIDAASFVQMEKKRQGTLSELAKSSWKIVERGENNRTA